MFLITYATLFTTEVHLYNHIVLFIDNIGMIINQIKIGMIPFFERKVPAGKKQETNIITY